MTKLLAQHGYGKGTKITDSLNEGNLNGAIFSPNDEDIHKICKYVKEEVNLNKDNSFLDPQFYFSTYNKENLLKKLADVEEYPTDIQRRDWRKKSDKIMKYLDYHANMSEKISNTLITPGFYIDNIDWKLDYSLDIYNYCLSKYEFGEYAISLLINFSFFNSIDNVHELIYELDEEIKDKRYIYFTISYDRGANFNYDDISLSPDADGLGNVLYFVYELKRLGYKIIVGYTFMDALLFSSLGCEYVANGWYNSLRKFQNDRFEDESSFGRRKKRYTSLPLLSNIMYDDIEVILRTGEIIEDDIISNTKFDLKYKLTDDSNISLVDLEHQFWESISAGISELDSILDFNKRINFFENRIVDAISMYQPVLEKLGQDPTKSRFQNRVRISSNHLTKWLAAIKLFKTQVFIR